MGFFSKLSTGIKVAAEIVPSAIELAKTFELPEAAGKGGDKKQAVIDIIKAVMPDSVEVAIGGDKTIEFIGAIIDIVGRFLNSIGVFKK